MAAYPYLHLVFGRPLQLISHEGASHEPYFWRLLLINSPDFNVLPDRHTVTKHVNKVFPAGGVLKEPAAAIPAMVIFTISSNGMFMYKINQYLLFGLINIVRIFNIQHINRTDGTLLKRAKEVPVTELFIVCISSRGMLRIPSTSCPTTVIPPSIVTMICFCSILSIFCSSSNIM